MIFVFYPLVYNLLNQLLFFSVHNDQYYVLGNFKMVWGSKEYFSSNFAFGFPLFLVFILVVPMLFLIYLKKFKKLTENKAIYTENEEEIKEDEEENLD